MTRACYVHDYMLRLPPRLPQVAITVITRYYTVYLTPLSPFPDRINAAFQRNRVYRVVEL